MIRAPNLTSLSITINNPIINFRSTKDQVEFNKAIEKSSNFAKIQSFMETTKNLKVLILNELNYSCIIDFAALSFPLEKLTISTYGSKSYNSKFSWDQRIHFNSSILMFLDQQKQSLKEALIDSKFLKMSPNLVFKFLLTSKLRKFSINCCQDKNNSIEFKYHKLNNELKYSGELSIADFETLILNFPQIINLSLNIQGLLSINALQMINNSMSNLKILSINPFFLKISENLILKNVEKLEIQNLYEKCGTVDWNDIALTCPNIKELSLYDDYFKIKPGRRARIIRKSKNLKIVKKFCKRKFSVSTNFYEFFLRPSMKPLEMTIFANITLERYNQLIECLLNNPNICVSYKMIDRSDKSPKSFIKSFKIIKFRKEKLLQLN
ncbi:unnamed protein product [Chironomus riparius]|uniref:Uncharacterized protein n=1 Tax=Chironomus riparius TaxID=315576 RepID=A0A9N9X121_9DIPT|nr:unnamed protein product [Chironomus riparius]